MSRGIVNQKPFTRKKRKKSFTKILNKSGISLPNFNLGKNIKKHLSRGLLFVLLIVCGIFFLLKSLIFKEEYKIIDYKIGSHTIESYDDFEVFNYIGSLVKGQNYFMVSNFSKEKIFNKIQTKYPFICDIDFQLEKKKTDENIESIEKFILGLNFGISGDVSVFSPIYSESFLKKTGEDLGKGGTIGIDIYYCQPQLAVKINDKKFAVRDKNTFVDAKDGNIAYVKRDPKCVDTDDNYCESKMFIEIPLYLSGVNTLSGFFQEISLPNMIKIENLAESTFNGVDYPFLKRFVYLAGSTRFAIFTDDDKTLYFNFTNDRDIESQWAEQIKKYTNLKNKIKTDKFNKMEYINLGLEANKVIFKNY